VSARGSNAADVEPRGLVAWYLRHTCGHEVTWLVRVGLVIAELARWPCPWCGGATGTIRPQPGVLLDPRIGYCVQGWGVSPTSS
jgi:hypothetical protein